MADLVLDAKSILERFSLRGRTALVTGGGQGIGRAFAHALADAGASVAVVDIDGKLAEQVAAELRAKSVKAMAIVADVTKPAEAERMVATVVGAWGELTIGVNNAGIGNWSDAETMSEQTWRKIMALNLDGVFYCAQAEAKVMIKKCYGKIINTASMSGHIVNYPQNQVPYNVSKAGVLHLTRSLSTEWAQFGIRVNSISPGYTKTALVDNLLATPEGKKMGDAWIPLIPVHKMAEVTDLQGAVVYLACEASDYMTGSDLVIDGGYCAW
jgi:NAD(P)-dependent dehydrogenase (short-subunit alcohol dehydrogenase family)